MGLSVVAVGVVAAPAAVVPAEGSVAPGPPAASGVMLSLILVLAAPNAEETDWKEVEEVTEDHSPAVFSLATPSPSTVFW